MVEIAVPPSGLGQMPPTAPPVLTGLTTVPLGEVHQPTEQLLNMNFCVDSNPSWLSVILLAFLHYIVMLGSIVMFATMLVPQMGGTHGDKARVIQTLLFMGGINTIIQTLVGTRLPTVMNASFTFAVPVMSIIRDFESRAYDSEHQRFVHTMRAIQGALIVASTVNILLGFTRAWGRIWRFSSSVNIVPLVCVVGLGLFERGFPQVGKCVEIGLPMLILVVVVQQYMRHLYHRTDFIFERYGLLFCIVIVWIFAAILTAGGAYNHVPERTKQHCRTDRSYIIASSPWIKIPYPFQWGGPIFSANHAFGMMGAVLVSAVEFSGANYAASRLAGATLPPTHVLSRSVGYQGVGMLLEGIFGAIAGSSAAVENVGLLGLTRVGSRRVVQISAGFMVFFGIFGKFGAVFASIPLPIFAAIYCVLFGIVAAVGVSFIQFANNNSMRNLYVIGVSLFLGVSVPQYFNEYTASAGHGPAHSNAGWFNDILNSIFSSDPTVALIVGTLLDSTLEARSSYFDRGLSWVERFQTNKDVRSDQFYSYPFKWQEWVPTRFIN